jgi:predicted dehydrogenase
VVHESTPPLRVGIIGLGPNWRNRYRPALLASRKRFTIRALYDQVQHLAAAEAQHLGCEAAEGLTDLLQRDDVDAVLLLDHQWFRLWPLELAARLGKPIFSVPSLATDAEQAEQLCATLGDSPSKVLFEFRPRCTPVTKRLRKLGPTRLGTIRLLLGQVRATGTPVEPTNAEHLRAEFEHRTFEWIDWCIEVMADEPVSVQAQGTEEPQSFRLENVLLGFNQGRSAQLNVADYQVLSTGSEQHAGTFQAEVIGTRGTVRILSPRRLQWARSPIVHQECLAHRRPPELNILRQFHRLATGHGNNGTGIQAARRTWRVYQAVRQSREEGALVQVPSTSE